MRSGVGTGAGAQKNRKSAGYRGFKRPFPPRRYGVWAFQSGKRRGADRKPMGLRMLSQIVGRGQPGIGLQSSNLPENPTTPRSESGVSSLTSLSYGPSVIQVGNIGLTGANNPATAGDRRVITPRPPPYRAAEFCTMEFPGRAIWGPRPKWRRMTRRRPR